MQHKALLTAKSKVVPYIHSVVPDIVFFVIGSFHVTLDLTFLF